jgi:hypothetical protein
MTNIVNTYQTQQNGLTPADATTERMRRMEDCLQQLLALEVDDRAVVISLVKEYENQALHTVLENRFGKDGVTLETFLSVFGDEDDEYGDDDDDVG